LGLIGDFCADKFVNCVNGHSCHPKVGCPSNDGISVVMDTKHGLCRPIRAVSGAIFMVGELNNEYSAMDRDVKATSGQFGRAMLDSHKSDLQAILVKAVSAKVNWVFGLVPISDTSS
jgi:hypothetical protein